jgi:hypothetical protein
MKILKGIGITIGGTLVLFLCAGFIASVSTGVNYITKPFELMMRKNNAEVDREVFENGKSHVESVARDLAKAKRELVEEKDETARKAIVNYINDTYANFDANNLEDTSLRQFLKDCRNGNIK